MRSKLTITTVMASCCWLAMGCGSLTPEQTFSFEMYGVNEAPDGASGEDEPRSQTYQVVSVDFLQEDGTTATTLYGPPDEAIEARIVNRPLVVYAKDLSELSGKTYAGVLVTLASTVEGKSKDGDDLATTVSNPVLSLTQTFTVEEAKELVLTVRVQWSATVTADAMTEPGFALSLE